MTHLFAAFICGFVFGVIVGILVFAAILHSAEID